MENAIKELTVSIQNLSSQMQSDSGYISIILSLFAIGVSIYSIKIQKKLNDVNLQAEYFKEIYGEYLKKRIPETGSKITYNADGRLNRSYRSVTKTMFNMLNDSKYFIYVDNEFYTELKQKIKDLDEHFVSLSNEIELNGEEQNKNIIGMHKEIEQIVKFIDQYYKKC